MTLTPASPPVSPAIANPASCSAMLTTSSVAMASTFSSSTPAAPMTTSKSSLASFQLLSAPAVTVTVHVPAPTRVSAPLDGSTVQMARSLVV